MNLLSDFLLNTLLWLQGLTGNLGWSIILFTVLIRSVLLPLTLPSLKATQKIRLLQPEMSKLKNKHGKDKQALQKAQMELYKKYNINPLAGCIPQIVQLVVLIVLYNVLIKYLGAPDINSNGVSTGFFWFDLAHPDPKFVLPVLAALTQLMLSIMISPGAETPDIVPNKSKSKKVQTENKKEENFAEMASSMQKQMLYIMPVMTGLIALRFPSGLALYWVISTVYSVVQQYFVSGWGGITIYATRVRALVALRR